MAKDLGMKTWRGASAWAALIDTVRRVLGLPERAATALEGAMAATEYSSWGALKLMACSFRNGLALLIYQQLYERKTRLIGE